MSTDWINDLRVVDLKEELKKRDLPVSGKKVELIARLTGAVEAEAAAKPRDSGDRVERPPQAAAAKIGEAAAEEDDTSKAKEHDTKGAEEPASAPVSQGDVPPKEGAPAVEELKDPATREEPVPEAKAEPVADVKVKEGDKTEAKESEKEETKEEVPVETPDTEKVAQEGVPLEAAAEAAEDKIAGGPDKQQAPDSATKVPSEAAAATASTDTPTADAQGQEERLPSMQAALLAPQPVVAEATHDADMEEAVDFEADDAEESEAPKTEQKAKGESAKTPREEGSEVAEQPEAKRAKVETDLQRQDSGRRKREPILFKAPGRVPPPATAATPTAQDGKPLERRSSVFDRIGSLNGEVTPVPVGGTGAPPTRAKPTRALLVTGFIRPFTLTAAQNLFKSYGEVEKMWMTAVRDKAYVLFKTEEAAEAARQGSHGLEWPHGNRTSLRPKFIPVEEAETVISSEGKQVPSAQKLAPNAAANAVAAASAQAAGTPLEKRRLDKVSSVEPASRSKAAPKPTPKKETTLEDLFRKTETVPHLYWLPLTAEQIASKQKKREGVREEGKKT